MILAISKKEISSLLEHQLNCFFFITNDEKEIIKEHLESVLKRCEYCFERTLNKYYHSDNNTYFSPYISTQYTIFLYYYANTIYKVNTLFSGLCDKIYYLNKTMNGVDIYYQVELPNYFAVEHPVGSVMGRAKYGEGLVFYQNCSVGGIHLPENKIIYPVLGRNVKLFAGSMVLGDCIIGDNVNIGAGALIKNQNVPSNVNVFGSSPNIIIKQKK